MTSPKEILEDHTTVAAKVADMKKDNDFLRDALAQMQEMKRLQEAAYQDNALLRQRLRDVSQRNPVLSILYFFIGIGIGIILQWTF